MNKFEKAEKLANLSNEEKMHNAEFKAIVKERVTKAECFRQIKECARLIKECADMPGEVEEAVESVEHYIMLLEILTEEREKVK